MDSQGDKFSTQNSPSPQFDAELFGRSLGESDDAAGFDRPWNPWSLVVVTFFFGVTAGVGLLAFNYQRLGIKGRLYGTIAIALVLEVLLTAVYVWAVQSGLVDFRNRNDMRTLRTAIRVVSVAAAAIIAQTQKQRFRLFQRCDLPAGNLLKPALVAIGVGIALDLIETAMVLPLILERS